MKKTNEQIHTINTPTGKGVIAVEKMVGSSTFLNGYKVEEVDYITQESIDLSLREKVSVDNWTTKYTEQDMSIATLDASTKENELNIGINTSEVGSIKTNIIELQGEISSLINSILTSSNTFTKRQDFKANGVNIRFIESSTNNANFIEWVDSTGARLGVQGKGGSGSDNIILQATKGELQLDGISINASNKRVTNVAEPTSTKDATTKNYVDTIKVTQDTSITTNTNNIKVLQDQNKSQINFKGVWLATTTYMKNDSVIDTSNKFYYISLKDNNTSALNVNSDWFKTTPTVSIDLSNYYTKIDTNNLLLPLETRLVANENNITLNATNITNLETTSTEQVAKVMDLETKVETKASLSEGNTFTGNQTYGTGTIIRFGEGADFRNKEAKNIANATIDSSGTNLGQVKELIAVDSPSNYNVEKVVDFELTQSVTNSWSAKNSRATLNLSQVIPTNTFIDITFKIKQGLTGTIYNYQTFKFDTTTSIVQPFILYGPSGANDEAQAINYLGDAMPMSLKVKSSNSLRLMWGSEYGTNAPVLESITFKTYKYNLVKKG